MSYCVTPGCFSPYNLDTAQCCQSCGAKLWLQHRYRPIKPIGQGGFGKTFLAADEQLPTRPHCVIKQLYLENFNSPARKKATQLFYQEAVRLSELGNHSQIPTLLAYFEQNRQLYLCQEWIGGQTLSQELQKTGVYTERQIWEVLESLLPVLHYIHQRRVIHRDIKPDNIISRGGELVLIDFGIAKLLADTALLQTGTVIGTPEYMAPEQLKGRAFAASDLYSLGVSCIYLLTKVSPSTLYDPANDRWRWRDYLPTGKPVSDGLGRVLDKLLATPVNQRYQSADEVLRSLCATTEATPLLVGQTSGNTVVEVELDYTLLKRSLVRRKWQEADHYTWDLLCQALEQPKGYYLKTSDILNLPCQALRLIDWLWVKYSRRRFGFSVQARIYQEVGRDYPQFCDRVGWPVHNNDNPDTPLGFFWRVPDGYLPSRCWVGGYSWWRHLETLTTKLEQCGIKLM